ncbi:MAG: hypothetical protein P8075_03095 [Deltaproteobacteria bacterium]|jgi:hypothetical protein
MKKGIVFGLAVVVALMLGLGSSYAQPMGPGMMGQRGGYGPGYGPPQQGGWYCPRGGGWGMGPGMRGRGRSGYGMGPGMTGRGWSGYGMGPGMMGPGYGYGPQYQQPQKPLEKSDVETMMKNYLASVRNPNLKLGKIAEKDNGFEVDIVTKDNSLVDKILVDKNTGWMRSAY